MGSWWLAEGHDPPFLSRDILYQTLNHKMHRYYSEIVQRQKSDFSTQQRVIGKSSPTSGKTENVPVLL